MRQRAHQRRLNEQKALKIYAGFIGSGSPLAAILASLFVDAMLKGKDEAFDVDELVGMTGANDVGEVQDALRDLVSGGIINIDVEDWESVGSIVPVSVTLNMVPRQGALDLSSGKAPQGRHDRSIGEDSVVIGGVEYFAALAPLPPEPGPYTMTIHAEEGDDRVLKAEYQFEGDGAETVKEAWAWFDSWVDALKEKNDPLFWLRSVAPMDGAMTAKHFLLEENTFNLIKDSEMALSYDEELNGQVRTLVDTEHGVLVMALEGEAGARWPGLSGDKEPENADTASAGSGRKTSKKDPVPV